MRKYLLSALLALPMFLILLNACTSGQKTRNAIHTDLEYSRFIELENFENYSTAVIHNPWDSTQILQSYTLIRKGKPKPEQILGDLIEIPIDKIAVFSSVHAAILEILGAEDKISGICEPQYLTSKKLKKMVKEGKIADLGPASAPNIEKMIDIDTRFIISSPLENSGDGGIGKLHLPIIEGVDYMENTPLGRAEWIRFFALLLDQEELADSIFNSVEKRYMELKEAVLKTDSRPTLMCDLKYGGTWYISGTNSYMVNLYEDAGANYLFQDVSGSGSSPMNFEYVLDKAIDADYWVIKYYNQQDLTYTSLKKEYSPYAKFAPFKNRKIFGCNTAYSNYYDDIILHPELILEDLVKILHPEMRTDKKLFEDSRLHYFQPLQ